MPIVFVEQFYSRYAFFFDRNKNFWLWNKKDYAYEIQSVDQWPSGDDGGWIKTTWDQGPPYNNLCPMDGSSKSIVGCVATAMAQIVNFHQYPRSISFGAEDSYTTDTKGIVVNSFDEVNSELSHIDYSDSLEQYAPAVSFACGIIVKMDYTSSDAWRHQIVNLS